MTKPTPYIIGISLGTRSTGIAIIQNHSLIYWKIITFKEPWSKKKPQIIVTKLMKLISGHPSNTIGIKIPSNAYCSKELHQLIFAFQSKLSEEQKHYQMLSIYDLKAHCFANEKKNKKALVECIGNKYPELYLKYRKEHTNKNLHYTKLFEAIIAAEIVALKR